MQPQGVFPHSKGAHLNGKVTLQVTSRLFVNLHPFSGLTLFPGVTQSLDLDWHHSIFRHAQLVCRGIGEVDYTTSDKWAAVIDADQSLFTVSEVGYPNVSIKREGFVGGGAAVHVIALTVGSKSAVKFTAVPRGQASLDKAGGRRNWIVALTSYRIVVTLICFWWGAGAGNKQKEKKEEQDEEGISSAMAWRCEM
jgi:hypothetical protein